MKKGYTVTIIALILIGLGFSVYQYVETMKTEVAIATQTIPDPGHSWSQMESGPDSIQISGRTITNLSDPVNDSDAATKGYVVASTPASAGVCYTNYGGSTCYTGFTAVLTGYSTIYYGYSGAAGGVLCSSIAHEGTSNSGAYFRAQSKSDYNMVLSNEVCAICCK